MSEQLNIAVVCGEELRKTLFTEKALNQLRAIGQVKLNPHNEMTAEELTDFAKDADIVITSWGSPMLTEEVMEKLPRLKLVGHAAGSVKPIVSDAMFAKGVRVFSSAKVLSMGVSETALGLTIASLKNFWDVSRGIAAGGWTGEEPFAPYDNIRELSEVTIGVVGGGIAGSHYIRLLSMFAVDVVLYDPFISEEKAAEMGTRKVSFEELLQISDVVSIHAPSIPETYHMFNADTLKLMKKDATLINTARGSLVDEAALYEHMKNGNLKYACMDVFDPEPPKADHPLRTLSNCIMTPHLAGQTHNGLLRIGRHCAEEVARFAEKGELTTEILQEQLSKMA